MSKHRAAPACPARHRATTARPGRRLLSGPLVVVLFTALCALGGTASVVPAAASADISTYQGTPAMAPSTYERRIRFWINLRRREHGLERVRFAACTDRVAERWGRKLALHDTFYHQKLMPILIKCDAYYAGETLGRGSIAPRRLVYLWMHSPEHRAVLLSPHARRIGIGSYPDRYGRWVTAVDFMHF